MKFADKELAYKLYLEGKTYREIGAAIGTTYQYVQRIVRPPNKIYNLIKKRAKSLCESCGIVVRNGHIHHKKRIKNFNSESNLEYLCPSCHRKKHSGIGNNISPFRLIKVTGFARELKEWRGKRGQKEVGDLDDWTLKSYQAWEQGRQPSRFRINQIRKVMHENPEKK